MGQLGFLIDMTQCSGCHCCQIACKDVKDLDVGVLYRKVLDFEGGEFPDVWAASMSTGCNHCAHPYCEPNCPVAAIKKDDVTGLVVQDQTMCIGCERCMTLCPYHAPAYIPDKKVVGKCDGCYERVCRGEDPACVAACSTRALHFGDLEKLRTQYVNCGLASDFKNFPPADQTTPSLLIIPKKELL